MFRCKPNPLITPWETELTPRALRARRTVIMSEPTERAICESEKPRDLSSLKSTSPRSASFLVLSQFCAAEVRVRGVKEA